MFQERTSIGLDVHARSVVASATDVVTGETVRARFGTDSGGRDVEGDRLTAQVVGWVVQRQGPCAVAYEAGPTGFGLARALTAAGVRCVVAAPSKLTRPAGDRVKTDARDAELLDRLLRLDELTEVEVPSVAREGARDLVRAREDCRGDLMRARHRLSKLLLRHGWVYPGRGQGGGQAWTARHDRWLRGIRLDSAAAQAALDSDYDTVTTVTARRGALDVAITAVASDSEFTAMTRRLGCLRGISTLTGFALAVEIGARTGSGGDWARFNGNTIGAFLGLVPTEQSSGASRRLGSITKTGNAHARRLLIEAAWHHKKHHHHPGVELMRRWELAGPAARARGEAGNRRLHQQWDRFTARNKRSTIATVAIARELAGWCWSLAVLND